jgi:hypothetical protein
VTKPLIWPGFKFRCFSVDVTMVAATPLASGSDQHQALPSKIEKSKTQSGPQRGGHGRAI